MVWLQTMTDILLVLILDQTVCKGYLQMIKVTASKKIVKISTKDLNFRLNLHPYFVYVSSQSSGRSGHK